MEVSEMEERKIGQIKEELKAATEAMLPSFIMAYESDERSGVIKLVEQAKKRLQKLEEERKRIWKLQEYERKYGQYTYICGIDEVGRGPLAGPVVAGAVILPKDCDILYINDSKKLTAQSGKNSMMKSWRRRLQQGSEWYPRSGSMRSIFCRQPMKRCARL